MRHPGAWHSGGCFRCNMVTTSSSASPAQPRARTRALRVGFLALTDAAPLIVAQELGLFARHGLQVELRREIGWATIREKVIFGELEAAQAPAPLLWSMQLGLGCIRCNVVTALVLNLHGNAITLSRALWESGVRDAATLREHLGKRRSGEPLTLGMVFPYSSPHLLLRTWLRKGGIDPDNDVRLVVVPPAQMFRNLRAQTIDGFCAGEPWNTLAVLEGEGWCPSWSAAQPPLGPEKVLLVTQHFAANRPEEHAALVSALAEAGHWCDEPQHRLQLAGLLAQPRWLNLPARALSPGLLGPFDCGHGRILQVPDFLVFQRGDAGVPSLDKALELQSSLGQAGLIPAAAAGDRSLARRLFREDLHRHALSAHHPAFATPTL